LEKKKEKEEEEEEKKMITYRRGIEVVFHPWVSGELDYNSMGVL
jgi:hypothetical protein